MSRIRLFSIPFILLLIFPSVSALAFKAPDESRELTRDDIFLEAGSASLRDALKLKTVLIRNLNIPAPKNNDPASLEIISRLMRESGSEPIVKGEQVDPLGYRHIRLSQRFRGIPVIGAEIVVHINADGMIYQVNGTYLSEITSSTEPTVDSQSALDLGVSESIDKADFRVTKAPALAIFGGHLAYHFEMRHDGSEPAHWIYYVDAHTGKLVFRINTIKFLRPLEAQGSQATVDGYRLAGEDGALQSIAGFYENLGTQNYFLYNFSGLWGVYDEIDRDWEQQASSSWESTDRHAVSCAGAFETIQAYVTTALGRYSFDDGGAFARANVHASGSYCPVNAWWDGTDFHFCDGDGLTADELCVLDIAAHEYGHAITDSTSNLIYSNESGALNEAYSDIMGAAVEFYSQPDGTASYPASMPGHSDYLIGEDAWLEGEALRNIQEPLQYSYPSYYKGTHWYFGTADYGGVHTNGMVACFAYYLLAEGGQGTNDGHPYGPITGIGRDAAAEVALRANIVYHTPSDQYRDAREAWISAAIDLGYPVSTVESVWDAVGVKDEQSAITLFSPENGELPVYPAPTFAWGADSSYRFKIQFSPDSTFPPGFPTVTEPRNFWQPAMSTDTIPESIWARVWNAISRMEKRHGTVYWRVIGRSGPTAPIEMSETRSFTISDN